MGFRHSDGLAICFGVGRCPLIGPLPLARSALARTQRRPRLPAGAPAARKPYNRRHRATWCLHSSSSSMGGELEGIPFGIFQDVILKIMYSLPDYLFWTRLDYRCYSPICSAAGKARESRTICVWGLGSAWARSHRFIRLALLLLHLILFSEYHCRGFVTLCGQL